MRVKRFILVYMTLDGQAGDGSFGEICGKTFATKVDALEKLAEITAQDMEEMKGNYPEEDGYTIVIEPGKMEETELNVYDHGDVVYQTRYKIEEVYDS